MPLELSRVPRCSASGLGRIDLYLRIIPDSDANIGNWHFYFVVLYPLQLIAKAPYFVWNRENWLTCDGCIDGAPGCSLNLNHFNIIIMMSGQFFSFCEKIGR